MITILASIGVDQVKRRFEECAHSGRYEVEEWLLPAVNGKGLRVAATVMLNGRKHGLGFKWDGEDINVLAERCIALDALMSHPGKTFADGRGLWKDATIQ